MATHRLYQSLVHLYPRSFREEYGEDLVGHFAELVSDRGVPSAWARTALDLVVTIPRYHLEDLMSEQRITTILSLTIGVLAVGGLASLFVDGAYPGMLLFVVAVVLAVAQHSRLARALRVPDSRRRRRLLLTAGVLGAIFPAAFGAYLMLIGDSWTIRETVLTVIGTSAMIGAVGFLVVGLLTPRTPAGGEVGLG